MRASPEPLKGCFQAVERVLSGTESRPAPASPGRPAGTQSQSRSSPRPLAGTQCPVLATERRTGVSAQSPPALCVAWTVGTEVAPIQAVSSVVTEEHKSDCQQDDHDLDAKVTISDDGACTTRRI